MYQTVGIVNDYMHQTVGIVNDYMQDATHINISATACFQAVRIIKQLGNSHGTANTTLTIQTWTKLRAKLRNDTFPSPTHRDQQRKCGP